jgi:glycosyltransferase involved in cell wall biosynthesis
MLKFSIVIPIYNSEKTLGLTLNSCIEQTYPNIEIICINDCSTDSSHEILQQYSNQDNRFFCIDLNANVNLYMARKTGLQYITGDYVLFLDSDDTLVINACELLEKKIKNSGDDIIIFGYKTVPNESIFFPNKFKTPEQYLRQLFYVKPNIPNAVWSRIYRKEPLVKAFSQMADFNAFMAEDLYISVIVFHFAKTINRLKIPLLNYNITSGKSKTPVFDIYIYESYLKSYNTVLLQLELFLKTHNSPFFKYYPNVIVRCINDFILLLPSNISFLEKKEIFNLMFFLLDDKILDTYFQQLRKNSNSYYDIFENCSGIKQITRFLKLIIKNVCSWHKQDI